jgi:hypothetical protein
MRGLCPGGPCRTSRVPDGSRRRLFVRCPRSGVDTSLTRRYHRLLIAPLDPPLDRALVFAKADTELVVGRRLPLSTSTDAVLFVLLVLEILVNGREQFGSA